MSDNHDQEYQGNNRRYTDGEFRSELRSMSEHISHMRTALEEVTKELRKITILEERNAQHAKSLDNAFTSLRTLEESNNIAHTRYDKFIWFATGVTSALSVIWTIFGVYITSNVQETMLAVKHIEQHVESDKITTTDDVREIIEKEMAKAAAANSSKGSK